VGGGERLRLFLGLRLPSEALDEIERWQAAQLAGAGVRVVGRDQLHVTLAFLGSRPAEEVDAIFAALREAALRSREIRLTPVRYRETRSVGMLVLDDGDDNAAALAGDVQERLERLGVYRRESRPWLPHLTVARWRERPRLQPAPPPDRTFVPSDAAAYVSRLHAGGARYAVLKSVPLGGE
jgi:RNA 2',3'-cyclic 3'-phosphodiesterase